MKNAKSKVKFMCLCLILSLFLSGCRIGGREVKFTFGLGSQEVFKIGDRTISLTQAKVYLSNYQNIYGNAYGLNLWKNKDTNSTLEGQLLASTVIAVLLFEQSIAVTLP